MNQTAEQPSRGSGHPSRARLIRAPIAHDDAPGRVFAALADGTRRAILDELRRAPAGPTAIAKHVGVSQPAVTKHLGVLERAGLVERRVHGRNTWCMLRGEALTDAIAWLERYRGFWQSKLGDLAAMFEPVPPSAPRTDRTASTPRTARAARQDKQATTQRTIDPKRRPRRSDTAEPRSQASTQTANRQPKRSSKP